MNQKHLIDLPSIDKYLDMQSTDSLRFLGRALMETLAVKKSIIKFARYYSDLPDNSITLCHELIDIFEDLSDGCPNGGGDEILNGMTCCMTRRLLKSSKKDLEMIISFYKDKLIVDDYIRKIRPIFEEYINNTPRREQGQSYSNYGLVSDPLGYYHFCIGGYTIAHPWPFELDVYTRILRIINNRTAIDTLSICKSFCH